MLECVGQREEEEEERSFGPFAENRGADGRKQHQEVDIEAEATLSQTACRVPYEVVGAEHVREDVDRDDERRRCAPARKQEAHREQDASTETPDQLAVLRVPRRR